MPVFRHWRLGRLVAVTLLCAGAAGVAFAQPGEDGGRPRDRERGEGEGRRFRGGGGGGGWFGGRGFFEPSLTTRSLGGFAKVLELTPDQQTAANALLDGYQQSFRTLASETRERMSAFRERARADFAEGGPSPEMMRAIGEEMDKFRKARENLDKSFFDDLKAVLTPEQAERWPALERMHRREQTIGRGLLSGERVDLIRTVEQMDLPPESRAELGPVLDQYAAELDRALVARNAAYDTAQAKVREAMESRNPAVVEQSFQAGREASLRVREVNRKYARQIEGLLPEGARGGFTETVKRQSFPMIYRPSRAGRAVEAAAEVPGLDESQRTAVEAIRQAFMRDMAAINRDLETAWQEREASVRPQDVLPRRFGGGGFDMDEDPRIADLFRRRNELQEATLAKLRSTLTQEQFDALPGQGRGGEDEEAGDDEARPRRRRAAPEGDEAPVRAPRQPTRPGRT